MVNAIVDTIASVIDYFKNDFSFDELYNSFVEKSKSIIDAISTFIGDVMSKVADWFMELPNKIGEFLQKANEKVAEFGSQMADMSQAFIKKILQAVLPRKDNNQPWYSIPNLTSSAIPDSVYKFAGINPVTGQIVEAPNAKISSVPNVTPSSINTSSTSGTTIINNISRGGDTNNVSNSNVNQNINGAASPIWTGSTLGLYGF